VRPIAISVDAPEATENLKKKSGYTYSFLSDPNTEVIRRYDLLHKVAGVEGHDIARPAEILVDKSGVVRWVSLTEDLRVRARPEQMIAAAKQLR